MRLILLLSGLVAATAALADTDYPIVIHELDVLLVPDSNRLEVVDRITLPATLVEDERPVSFTLHKGMSPVTDTPGARLESKGRVAGYVPLEGFNLYLPPGTKQVTLRYAGRIHHQLETSVQDVGKPRIGTPGIIGADGVFIDGTSGWYPYLPDTMLEFRMTVTLPAGWLAVSQGRGPDPKETAQGVQVSWREEQPQDDIYLVAARFHLYQQETPHGEAQVYLRQPDAALAERYLTATAHYLDIYSRLLGRYPYAKFALVENFWETGYGMPSFTLLGSRVLRLPFILHSAYPHEILHNWWGNSVYVDYETGNWSEGLTAYLADHLVKEARGEGAEYRRNALKRYTEYVDRERDFPLLEFRARHGGASQAVGYDKSLMLFHMLRLELGDDRFLEGLRRFYQDNRFRTAGFTELRRAFEATAGRDLCESFVQWLERTGAPSLRLGEVHAERAETGYMLRFTLEQTQPETLFTLQVPVAIQLQGWEKALVKTVKMAARRQTFTLTLPDPPLRLVVDPRFDVFRRLDPAELPPSLGRVFASKRPTLVLPSGARQTMRRAYQELAQSWAQEQPHVRIVWDNAIDVLPDEAPVWLLGWENRFLAVLRESLPQSSSRFDKDGISILGERYPSGEYSLVLTANRQEGQALAWMGAHSPEAVPGLARKLPHYGKYSYLAFTGKAPDNVLKGQWPVSRSPLQRQLVPDAPQLRLPDVSPLLAQIENSAE